MEHGSSDLEALGRAFDYTPRSTETRKPTAPALVERLSRPFVLCYLVGDSGSGKTTALHTLNTLLDKPFLSPLEDQDVPIASLFTDNLAAMTKLGAAGLNTVPSWFRRYRDLSAGEQYRAMVALKLKSNVLVDEFCSNVDRGTARSMAYSLGKYVRTNDLHGIVLAGCNFDIVPWLKPDVCFDVNTNTFVQVTQQLPNRWSCRLLERDESIESICKHMDKKEAIVARCSRERWTHYSPYHYMSTALMSNSDCWELFVKIDGRIRGVGFLAVAPFPARSLKCARRAHRLVVHPAFQGMGLGPALLESVAKQYVIDGHRFFIKTSHPQLGNYQENSPNWTATSWNKKRRKQSEGAKSALWASSSRTCFCHEFVVPYDTNTPLSMAKAPLIQSLEDNAHKQNAPPTWRPLHTVGTIRVDANGNAIARIKAKYTRFEVAQYGTPTAAKEAAHMHIEKVNMENLKTNLYRTAGEHIEIDLGAPAERGPFMLVDKEALPLLSVGTWRLRNERVYHHSSRKSGGRVYIEQLLYPDIHIKSYKDGNRLNKCRSNIVS